MKRIRFTRNILSPIAAMVIAMGLNINNAAAFPNPADNQVLLDAVIANCPGDTVPLPASFDCGACHTTVGLSDLKPLGSQIKNKSPNLCAAPANTAPVANAGPDQSKIVNDLVTLNGNGSSDADGDSLTYSWTFVTTPLGSSATLFNPSAIKPTFTADVEGSYEVMLIVNDAMADSAADSVIITIGPGNTAPVANAGPDQSVTSGDSITLNGSGSSDADGDSLTYQWSFTSIPAGSSAVLSNSSAAMPTFTADLAGDYDVQLIVNDGIDPSTADSVTIAATDAPPVNVAPIANAGPDQAVTTLNTVTLDGTGSSDADGDSLSFSWTFSSKPAGSSAALSGASTATPTFTADVDGDYAVQLIVRDGIDNSAPDTVMISATSITVPPVNIAPIANAGMDQNATPGDIIQLDGSASSDANNDPLTYSWSFASKPATSLATLSDTTAAMPTFVADVTGDYVAQLIVGDGADVSTPDSVTVSVNDQPTNVPTVILRLKLDPSRLVIEKKELGNKVISIRSKVVLEQEENDLTTVMVGVAVTHPDGSKESLVQKRQLIQKRSIVKTTFMPKMEGKYFVSAIVEDKAGNVLSSTTRTLKVILNAEDDEDDEHEDGEDGEDDEHEDGEDDS